MQNKLSKNSLTSTKANASFYSHDINDYSRAGVVNKVKEIQMRLKQSRVLVSGYKLEQLFEIIDELTQFALGRFLIMNQGLNGYWTDYVLNHEKPKELSNLEHFLIYENLLFLATRERHLIFLQENQEKVFDGAKLASIPCGLMSELTLLDFSKINHLTITGIDLDANVEELILSKYKTQLNKVSFNFICKDAWQVKFENSFDLISCNGLTIYIEEDDKVLSLFKVFHQNLKSGGKLVTSFITFNSSRPELSEQKIPDIKPENIKLSQAIFADTLSVKWLGYRTTSNMKSLLELAGFKNIKVIPDKYYIFPTIVGYK